ncbi:MAG: hypothetical protein M9962_12045 [Oligoflexia bacterium]|nr:hypothetical protein [Oligoflexia bacterium]
MTNTVYETHGKCILLGEHSVVRGYPAIVLPLYTKTITLKPSLDSFSPDFSAPIEKCLQELSRLTNQKNPEQTFLVESNIPVRAGLGSSAALSVALTRWWNDHISPIENIFETALRLENIFHGRSSGLDIAASLAENPIYFQKGKIQESFSQIPGFFSIHDSLERSSTKECVQKVEQLGRTDLDEAMNRAVSLAASAINEKNTTLLAKSLEQAYECFSSWGLVTENMTKLRADILKKGALAVKPTGSGAGGFLLAYWDEQNEDRFSFH